MRFFRCLHLIVRKVRVCQVFLSVMLFIPLYEYIRLYTITTSNMYVRNLEKKIISNFGNYKLNDLSQIMMGNNITYVSKTSHDENLNWLNLCSANNFTKKHSIYFLKVHKTGSTTFRNILQRHTLKHNLSYPFTSRIHTFPVWKLTHFLVPIHTYWNTYLQLRQKGVTQLNATTIQQLKKTDIETRVKENQCNILDIHTVFVKEEAKQIFPPDVTCISTLRHPLNWIRSSFTQWNLAAELGLDNFTDPVGEFLNNPSKYDKILLAPLNTKKALTEGVNISYTKNYMAFEFGFNLSKLDNESYINEYLSEINKTFEIVVITEHFIESLVLVKRHLCWKFEDVIFLALRNQSYHSKYQKYSESLSTNYRKWSNLDHIIYDMFKERHDGLLKAGGSLLNDEIVQFKSILNEVNTFCKQVSEMINLNKVSAFPSLKSIAEMQTTIKFSRFNEEFNVTGADCVLMTINESRMWMASRVQQYPFLCDPGFANFLQQLNMIGPGYERYCVNPNETFKYNFRYNVMHAAFWKGEGPNKTTNN